MNVYNLYYSDELCNNDSIVIGDKKVCYQRYYWFRWNRKIKRPKKSYERFKYRGDGSNMAHMDIWQTKTCTLLVIVGLFSLYALLHQKVLRVKRGQTFSVAGVAYGNLHRFTVMHTRPWCS